MANIHQPVMDLRIRATLKLTGSSDEAMLAGAKVNRELVAKMAELGYEDVALNISMHNKRLPKADAELDKEMASAAKEVADGGAAAMARKLAKP